jgi:hypothetical protein
MIFPQGNFLRFAGFGCPFGSLTRRG